jgi:oxygen-dependent protoporphyrinogen oxidase
MKRVVVVGGGVSGLTTALHLKDRAAEIDGGLEVLVLEASGVPGGNIRTQRVEGFVIERGPNGYLDNVPTTPALVRRLGLEGQIQKADESAANRYLFRNGKLHLLPTGPIGFLSNPVLSLSGRLRVFGEPFAPPRPRGVDETIFQFASRRIGTEAASILIDAMVSGVFAGNVHELSLAASFPRMARMEEEHGGLVKAMLAGMRAKRRAKKEARARRARGEDVGELTRPGGPAGPGGTLTSFNEGLDTLPDALAEELGDVVRLDTRVMTVSPSWAVRLANGELLRADAVVVAVPAPMAHPILGDLEPELASAIAGISTAPLAVVALAYDAETMGGAPNGFGFLVPRGTGPRILGCLWDSSIFPGRAPEGKVLMRAMIGGAHDPEALTLEDREMVDQVRSDLRLTMGLEAEPLFTQVYRWRLGIGQYTVGHLERLEAIHRCLEDLPGLWVAGSSFYGISMNACIEKAGHQAGEILEYLGSRVG